jgi:hypothetical protein
LTTSALERGYATPTLLGLDGTVLVACAMLISVLWLMWALDQVRGVAVACWRGIRAGFGWLTLLEVGADTVGNTGDLMASRGGATTLDASQRRGLRMARITATLATALSAVLTLCLFAGIVRFGALDRNHQTGLMAIAAVALLGAVVRGTMRAWERSQFPRDRWATRMRPTAELRERAAVWSQGFERHSDPAGFGQGPASGAIVAHAWHVVILALGAFAFVVTLFILIANAAGRTIIEIATPELGSIERRYESTRALQRWQVPVDAAIAPLDAGIAFATMDHRRWEQTGAFALRDKSPLPTPPWADSAPPGLRIQGRAVTAIADPWIDSVTRRLTPVELAWMREVTAYPGWDLMRTVARASRVDLIGGRFELPFPEEADVFAMPIVPVLVYREYGSANAFRIRYYLETNRPDSAVLAARELLSVGLRLTEDARWAIESLLGMILANQGRNQLERVYGVLRDPQRDTLLRITRNAAQMANERRRSQWDREPDDAVRIVERLERLAMDTTRLRSIRWEAMSILGLTVCMDARSLLRGPSEAQRARFDGFVAAETRWASDTALIDMIRDRPLLGSRPEGGESVAVRAADALGALLGTPYLATCSRYVGNLGI